MAHLRLCLEPGQPQITGLWSHGLGREAKHRSESEEGQTGQTKAEGERGGGKCPGGSPGKQGSFVGLFPCHTRVAWG